MMASTSHISGSDKRLLLGTTHLCPSYTKLNYANNIHYNVLGFVQRQQLKNNELSLSS